MGIELYYIYFFYVIHIQILTSVTARNWTTAIHWVNARTCSARSNARAQTATGTHGSETLSVAAGPAKRATQASATSGENASSRQDSQSASKYLQFYYTLNYGLHTFLVKKCWIFVFCNWRYCVLHQLSKNSIIMKYYNSVHKIIRILSESFEYFAKFLTSPRNLFLTHVKNVKNYNVYNSCSNNNDIINK